MCKRQIWKALAQCTIQDVKLWPIRKNSPVLFKYPSCLTALGPLFKMVFKPSAFSPRQTAPLLLSVEVSLFLWGRCGLRRLRRAEAREWIRRGRSHFSLVDTEAAGGSWRASGQRSGLGNSFPPYNSSVSQCWKERCELCNQVPALETATGF